MVILTRFALGLLLALSAACGGGGVVGGGSSSSRPAQSEPAGLAASDAPPAPAASAASTGSAGPAPAPGPAGFDGAEALSKAIVAAQGSRDADAARALYPSDAVIDGFASCKGVKNLKFTLQRRREAAADAVTHPEKGAPAAYEWLSLEPPGKPRRRRVGKEVDGCTFKTEVAYYKLAIRARLTPPGDKAKKPKKKTKRVDALVVGGRWYLASKL